MSLQDKAWYAQEERLRVIYLWQDVIRTGLNNLVAVDEVIMAANKVADAYQVAFGPHVPEPEVPESFYDLGVDPFADPEE